MCEPGGQREGWPQKLGIVQGAVIFLILDLIVSD